MPPSVVNASLTHSLTPAEFFITVDGLFGKSSQRILVMNEAVSLVPARKGC